MIRILVILVIIGMKVYPENTVKTEKTEKTEDITYNVTMGIICGMCICICMCIGILLIITYTIKD